LAPLRRPRFKLDGRLIGWEANDEIPRKRMLLVKWSVSEQWNQDSAPFSRTFGRHAAKVYPGRGLTFL